MKFEEALEKRALAPEKTYLIDVRTAPEYHQTHIEGAILLPLDAMDSIGEITTDKEDAIFLYCRSGRRSGMAKVHLEAMGYTEVVNLGGIIDYLGPVVSG